MTDLISVHEHTNPDAQATVTDFIDYTEYLPSDLERALTLIRKLDQTYETSTTSLHELLKSYCDLPRGEDKQASVLEAEDLRAKISNRLDLALHVRESAYIEAARLQDDMQRHRLRLTSIHTKLLALPKPPSRDPTPAPVQSPQLARRELGEAQRLKLRADGARTLMKKYGAKPTPRVIVPGEVLPPRNPDSPTASMYDDFTSSESSSSSSSDDEEEGEGDEVPLSRPLGRPKKLYKPPKTPKTPKMKIPKIHKDKKERPPRPPRPHGVMGTNVHSAVAGISTSNALMLLDPPPVDARLGSEHAPWMRLTEWEMAKLRKRMKKNAIWAPSDTMIRRELADAGRGPDAYYSAKNYSEETGEEFVDSDDLANREMSKPLLPGEIPLDSVKTKVFNKGMSLNVQKKKKRDLEALQAKMEIEQANASLSHLGTKMSTIFSKPSDAPGEGTTLQSKKRKRDGDGDESATEESKANAQLHSEAILASKPGRRWGRKGAAAGAEASHASTTITTISSVDKSIPTRNTQNSQPSSPIGVRKLKGTHVSIKDSDISTTTVATAILSRPASRQSSRRTSTIPETTNGRDHLKRKSTTPAPNSSTITLTSSAAANGALNSRLRNRRQAPGPVTNLPDGGAAVSIGKRKNAPRKKGNRAGSAGAIKKEIQQQQHQQQQQITKVEDTLIVTDEEPIDPNEETYCICGRVSFGTMIMCENPDVSLLSSFLPFPSCNILEANLWFVIHSAKRSGSI